MHPGPQELAAMIQESHRMLLELHERQDAMERAISLPGRLEQAREHNESVRAAARRAIRRGKRNPQCP